MTGCRSGPDYGGPSTLGPPKIEAIKQNNLIMTFTRSNSLKLLLEVKCASYFPGVRVQ